MTVISFCHCVFYRTQTKARLWCCSADLNCADTVGEQRRRYRSVS